MAQCFAPLSDGSGLICEAEKPIPGGPSEGQVLPAVAMVLLDTHGKVATTLRVLGGGQIVGSWATSNGPWVVWVEEHETGGDSGPGEWTMYAYNRTSGVIHTVADGPPSTAGTATFPVQPLIANNRIW